MANMNARKESVARKAADDHSAISKMATSIGIDDAPVDALCGDSRKPSLALAYSVA